MQVNENCAPHHLFFGRVLAFHKGYTLIELVLAIVIVAFLTSAALPRFFRGTDTAAITANTQFVSSFRASLTLLHAAWIAMGAPSSSTNWITLEGNISVSVNEKGWPSPNDTVTNPSFWSAGCAAAAGNYYFTNPVTIANLASGTTCTNVSGLCYYVPANASSWVCTYQQYFNGSSTGHGWRYNYQNGTVTTY